MKSNPAKILAMIPINVPRHLLTIKKTDCDGTKCKYLFYLKVPVSIIIHVALSLKEEFF